MDIYGTAGDDQLEHVYSAGIYIWINIWGGAGNDTIRTAEATAIGEAGNDTIIGVPHADGLVTWNKPVAGYGNSPAGVVINLVTGTVQDGFGTTDTLQNINWVRDSPHNDVIIGSARDEVVFLSGGNDSVFGGGGTDIAYMAGMRPDEVDTRYDIGTNTYTIAKHTDGGDTGTSVIIGIARVEFIGSTYGTAVAADIEGGTGKHYTGSTGADIVHSGLGDDVVDAGEGLDTMVYRGERAAYTVTRTESGLAVSGAHGSDTLTGIERVEFGDEQGLAFDGEGNAGMALRLYRAAFDRAPDDFGLGFWIAMMDQGVSREAVAGGFVQSDEFRDLYGAATNREIVEKMYLNILDRQGDPVGITFWTGVLDQRNATVAEVLAGFSESEENIVKTIGQFQDGVAYDPYG